MKHHLTAMLFVAVLSGSFVAAGTETRVLVRFAPPIIDHLLGNMRDHLLAITEIQRAIGRADYRRAAEISEHRLGMSSLKAHGAEHMAEFMPPDMREIGTRMHRAASRFALVAEEQGAHPDQRQLMSALSDITEQCVVCHARFRVR